MDGIFSVVAANRGVVNFGGQFRFFCGTGFIFENQSFVSPRKHDT